MKNNKKKVWKRLLAWICVSAILVSFGTDRISVYAADSGKADGSTEERTLNEQERKAEEWILSGANKDGSFGDTGLINDTCDVAALMALAENKMPDKTALWLKEKAEAMETNYDILARVFLAEGSEEILREILKGQNKDGGFGLNGSYLSDTLDSMLVLQCMVRKTAGGESCGREAERLLGYFAAVQNDDGGFGYTDESGSDRGLSLKIALTAAAYRTYAGNGSEAEWIGRLFAYIRENADFYGENPVWNVQYMFLEAMEENVDQKDAVKWLTEHQEEDGSFSENLQATLCAVYFMRFLEKQNQPYFYGGDMSTLLSAYVVYDGLETDLKTHTVFHYKTNRDQNGQIRIELMRNGEPETVLEEETVLSAAEETAELEGLVSVKGETGSDYVLRVTLYVNGACVGVTEEPLKVQKASVDEVRLDLTGSGAEGVCLEWNDITNEFYRYGYRIYRSTENGEFETRSSWDGEEKVRVLNVYPCPAAKNYLKEWMAAELQNGEGIAGKGLFEIDTVLIDDYNREPDSYLLNEEGMYRYDVLVFGIYDSNAYKDLNEQSYNATVKFMESGRGILFGHDTVIPLWKYFRKFGEPLGIKIIDRNSWVLNNKVKVVNTGFLTSYPWKIEGILTIPTTHASSQYTGGTTKATVWMEFTLDGIYDSASGTVANAYLVTHNQLALIQTGHSSGKVTDDECKILANTLFYLKQLTNDTQAADKSAYDLKPPVISEGTVTARNGNMLEISVAAEDFGTDYRYYVEAVPQGDGLDNMKRESNLVETTVTSGIAGYLILVSENDSVGEDMDGQELISPQDGIIRYELPETDTEKKYYLHICAADCAGNISSELIFEIPEAESAQPDIYGTGYGLFGAEDVTAYISELNVEQDVYSGGNITCAGSGVAMKGTVTAAGQINLYTGNTTTGERAEHSEAAEMPQLHEGILADMGGTENIEILNVYESTQINDPTWCVTTTGAYCPDLVLNAPLMCDNTVNIGAGSVICGQEKNVVLYSVNGDISINASKLEGRGLIYAPNGTVTINVQDMQFTGSIIAKRIMIQGTTIQISQENTNAE